MHRSLEIGAVLSRALDLYQRHWKLLMGIAAAIYLVGAVVTAAVAAGAGLGGAGGALITALAGLVVIVLASFVLQGMYVLAIDDIRDGRQDLTMGDLFERTKPRLGALIITSIIAGFGVMIGFLLFIVPGLVLLTWWALIGAVVMLEGRSGTDALRRSREIVRGNGWNVFFLIIVTAIITTIVGGIIDAVVTGILPGGVGEFMGDLVRGVVVGPVMPMVLVLAYFALAQGGEGAREIPEEERARRRSSGPSGDWGSTGPDFMD